MNEIVVYQLKNGLYTQVPHILEVLALHIIRLEGYTTEGIFRISGDGNDVMKLRTELQKGNYSCPIDNVHNAATLFKLFLRELAEPVFPTHFYPTALRVAEEGNVSGMHEMISQFDNINVKVIQFVVNFLLSFLKPNYIAKTMMTSGNMATVFAPTLLRCPSDNPLMQITAATSEVKFVTLLLDKFPSDLKVDITKLLSTTQ
uniref:Rho-GAP domain-containing protein n=1 Tax=Arcella intermedia TaxID=1963864 RepID=A0A6B2LIF8_9EUKA